MNITIDSVKIEYTTLHDGIVIEYIKVPELDRGKGLAKNAIYKLMNQLDMPRAFFCPTDQSIKRITGQPPAVMLPDGRIMFVIGIPPKNQYPSVVLYHDDRDGELYAMLVSERKENAQVHFIRDRSRFWDYYEYQARLLEEE